MKEALAVKETRRILFAALAFGVWTLATAFWSGYPRIVLPRGIYFLLLSGGIIAGKAVYNKKHGGMEFLVPANVLIILVSIFSLITGLPGDAWSGGNAKGFMGYFGHQNTLGAAILFTIAGPISALLNRKQNCLLPTKYYKLNSKYCLLNTMYYVLITFNLLLLLFSYSRASMLALVFALVVMLLMVNKKKGLAAAAILLCAGVILYSFVPAVKNIALKNFNTVGESRMLMWQFSAMGAKDGGLTGLGYGISDQALKVDDPLIHLENGIKRRETGSSTLALIEETGIIGLILFAAMAVFILNSLIEKYREEKPENIWQVVLPIGMFAAFILHAQFEGWMTGLSNLSLPVFLSML